MSKKIWSEFYKVANGQLAIENLSSEAKYEFNNLKPLTLCIYQILST